LSARDATGAEVGAGAGEDGDGGNAAGGDRDEPGGRVCAAAAPACLAGRVSPDGFAFAGLGGLAGLTGVGGGGGGGGAASEALAGVEL